MFATNSTTLDVQESVDFDSDFQRSRASELWCDAQVLDSASHGARRAWPRTQFSQRRGRERTTFSTLWLVIGVISAYDAFLAMKYRGDLAELERNPVGRLLLQLDGDGPAVFLGMKFLGTILVLGILAKLYHFRPHWAMAVAYGVSAFQVCLFVYLTWAGPGKW